MSRIYRISLLFLALTAGLTLAFAVFPAAAGPYNATLYAAPTPSGAGDCSSWADACTLQTALSNAVSGDQIWVEAGLHKPGVTVSDTFALVDGVAVYGGFNGTETALDQRDWETNITVLSGDVDNNDLTDPNGIVTDTANITGTNSYHVVSSTNVLSDTVLDGFIITAGQANESTLPNAYGGGMFNDSSSPSLTNLNFSGNMALGGGGGVFNDHSSSPILLDIDFHSNTAGQGGGILNLHSSHALLTNVSFNSNHAHIGGGIDNISSNPTLTNVTLIGNSAFAGGGMYNQSSNPTLIAVNFSGNSASWDGGGMYNSYSTPLLTDVTFINNEADERGGGIVNNDNSMSTLTSVTFDGNLAIYGGGMYNKDSDPILVDVIFDNNSALRDGGGMYDYNCSPILTGVTFSGNSASSGGGMHNHNSSPILTDVTFSGNTGGSGGGMANVLNSPMLTNVIFISNSVSNSGGGMSNSGSSPTLMNVTFSNNTAPNGGGMYNLSNSPILTNVIFSDNSVINYGGGMRNSFSSPTLTNVTFSGNSAKYGGGIANNNGNPMLMNVTFSGNSASISGGGMNNSSSNPTLTNATFSGNSALSGGGMYNSSSSPALTNAILWGNTATSAGSQIYNYNPSSIPAIAYSDIQDSGGSGAGWDSSLGTDGGGNVDADPLFVDFANGDIYLELSSPAIDAGDNLSVTVTTDLDGNPRFVDIPTVPDTGNGTPPIVDMGAYEVSGDDFPTFTSTPIITATQDVPYTYTITALDLNGDVLTITAPTHPAWLTLTNHGDGTATLSGTSTHAGVGNHPILLRVTDSRGLFTEQAYTLTVANVNDNPAFTSTPITTGVQDTPYTYTLTTTDPDLPMGDVLTLTAPTLPAWLTLTDHGDGTATLTGTPTNAEVGAHPVLLRVTDNGGLFAEQAYTLTVANVNEIPAFTSPPITTGVQDTPYTYTLTTTDPDLPFGDVLTITAMAPPPSRASPPMRM